MALGGPQGDEQPPAPGYWWDGTQWQPPKTSTASTGGAPPPPPPSSTSGGGGRLGGPQGDEQPPAPGYTWDGIQWQPPPTTSEGWNGGGGNGATSAKATGGAPGTTTANGVDQKQYDADALTAQQFAQGVTGQAGITPAHWETVTNPDGSTTQKYVPAQAGQAPRQAPQAQAPDGVIAGGATADKPQAVAAQQAAPVTSQAIVAPTIAPIERIQAATQARAADATAGTVQAATINQDPQAQFRQQQAALTSALEKAAAGTDVTSGELAARQQAEAAANEQRALAGASHGYGALAASRTAGRNIAGIEAKSAADQALIRQKSIEDARQELAGVLGQGREQDIGLATSGAQLAQQASTTNAQLGTQVSISNADREAARLKTNAELQQDASKGDAAAQNELNERQATLGLAASTSSASNALQAAQGNQQAANAVNLANAANATQANITGAQLGTQISLANQEEQLKADLANADNQTKVALANAGFTLQGRQLDDTRNVEAIKAALQAQNQTLQSDQQRFTNDLAIRQLDEALARGDRDFTLGVITSILGAGGAIGAAAVKSDRKAKTGIKKASAGEVDDLLSALEAWTYRYKKPQDGEGKRMGPMAQELERSSLGKGMVKRGPDGDKVVDTGALTMALAGAVARMRKEQRRAGRAA